MIDIHSHALYGVDDGSQSIEQSIKMIKMAKEVGFTGICLTPHYFEGGNKLSRGEIQGKLENIKEALIKENVTMDLYLGEEVQVNPFLAENLDDVILMNDSKYILIELPLTEEVNYLNDLVFKIQSNGKIPILAHPERYLFATKDFSRLQRLCKKGVLLEVNINSLTGHYGTEAKRIATKLLKEDMVQFLASDAHSSAGYHNVKESLKAVNQIISEEKVEELLEENPTKMIFGEFIEPWNYKFSEKSKKVGDTIFTFIKSFSFVSRML